LNDERVQVAAISDLTSQLAHDIRSPLDVLRWIVKEDTTSDYRDLIENAVSRINLIAADILVERRQRLMKNRTSVQEIVASIQSVVDEKMLTATGSRQLRLSIDCPSGELKRAANFSVADVQRGISNLLNNALEATVDDPKTSIRVALATKSNYLHIAIQDNGKGIPPDVLERMGRVTVTDGKKDGNGIGVISVATRLRAAGGDLQIASKLDHGTTVTLIISLGSALDVGALESA
jgi:signal transduction histidine kinase